MENLYSPYDPHLPDTNAARSEYISEHPDLSPEEREHLAGMTLRLQLLELTSNVRKLEILDNEAGADQAATYFRKSGFWCAVFTVLTFGYINPRNWADAIDQSSKEVKADEASTITSDHAVMIAKYSRAYNELETEGSRKKQDFSPAAQAIWNRLGDKRETFPRVTAQAPNP